MGTSMMLHQHTTTSVSADSDGYPIIVVHDVEGLSRVVYEFGLHQAENRAGTGVVSGFCGSLHVGSDRTTIEAASDVLFNFLVLYSVVCRIMTENQW